MRPIIKDFVRFIFLKYQITTKLVELIIMNFIDFINLIKTIFLKLWITTKLESLIIIKNSRENYSFLRYLKIISSIFLIRITNLIVVAFPKK